MSDQCRNCTIRGDIKKCLETDCFQHEDWWAQTVLAQLSEAQGGISKLHTSIEEYEIENDKWRNYYNNLKQETAALRATLAEKEAEIAAIRELMNCYNIGGWTDSVEPMKRALKAEAELAEKVKEIKRRNSKTWCAYCGFEIDIDDEASTKISEHIMSCPDHPIRLYERHSEALEAENAKLRGRMKRYKEYIEYDLDKVNLIIRKWENGGYCLINDLPPEEIMKELWQTIKAACEEIK